MKKLLALILMAVLCAAVFAGCGGQSPSQESASPSEQAVPSETGEPETPAEEPADEPAEETFVLPDKLIVGLDDTFAPMGFRNEASELVGFDIDLANAVGETLGIEIEFQPIDWNAKEMELEARTIDCVWNGMSRTPEREESMTLSQDYLNNKLIVMTAPGVEITSMEQLADYQIGTQAGSSALEAVQAHEIYASIEGNLHEYGTYDECILDMQAGRIEAMVVDEVLGQYKNNNLETKFGVASVDFGDDFYCIGFRKGDDGLCAAIESALKTLSENGKGEEISNKWFGENLLLSFN